MDLGDTRNVEEFECSGLDARTTLTGSVLGFFVYDANEHIDLGKCQGCD